MRVAPEEVAVTTWVKQFPTCWVSSRWLGQARLAIVTLPGAVNALTVKEGYTCDHQPESAVSEDLRCFV
jgi:hypothetical protein